jgi:hypothetical protein
MLDRDEGQMKDNPNLHLLKTLKKKLVDEKDFFKVMNYFFDYFGENQAFIDLGAPARHELLETILGQVGETLVGSPVVLSNLRTLHLPEHKFFHGACTINRQMATFFFFEDIQVGLMAVAKSLHAAETKIIRFTGYQVSKGVDPRWN